MSDTVLIAIFFIAIGYVLVDRHLLLNKGVDLWSVVRWLLPIAVVIALMVAWLLGYRYTPSPEEIIGGSFLLLVFAAIWIISWSHSRHGIDLVRRVKYAGATVGGALTGTLLLWSIIDSVQSASLLARSGTKVVAEVTATRTEIHRRSHQHMNTVTYGAHSWRLSLDREYPIGTAVTLVYAMEQPHAVRLGGLRHGPWQYYRADNSVWKIVFVPVLACGMLAMAVYCGRLLVMSEKALDRRAA